MQERFMDKTQIEVMEMIKPDKEGFPDEITPIEALCKSRDRLNIGKTNPKRFKFGTIVEKPEDIGLGQELTFNVYRVGIGKSFVSNIH